MDKFWELMEESVIVQGIVTVFLLGVVGYLVCTGQPVPDNLNSALMLVLGFYFGSKSQQSITKTVKRLGNGRTTNSTCGNCADSTS